MGEKIKTASFAKKGEKIKTASFAIQKTKKGEKIKTASFAKKGEKIKTASFAKKGEKIKTASFAIKTASSNKFLTAICEVMGQNTLINEVACRCGKIQKTN